MSVPGQVVEVVIDGRGSSLASDVAANAMTVTVVDPTPFDKLGTVLIDGQVYDYTLGDPVPAPSDADGNPNEYGVLNLTTGLAGDVPASMPVTLWSGDAATGQALDDVKLMVDTFNVEADPVPVTIASELRDRWTTYEGVLDNPIPGDLSDDQSLFVADPGWTPAVDGRTIDPATLPEAVGDPTLPPATVPSLQVFSASGGAAVTWDPPADVRTRLRLFVTPQPSDGSVPPMDATTMWGADVRPNTIVQTVTQGGDPLDPAVTYLFALQSYFLNSDGTVLDGPFTDWQTGTPGAYFPVFFSAQAIIETLQTQTLTGLSATFDQATFNDNITIYGGSQSTLSGPMYAAQGVTSPAQAPTVTLDWDMLQFNTKLPATIRSLFNDSAYGRWLTVNSVDPGYSTTIDVYAINKTTGVVNRYSAGLNYSEQKPLGITKIGDNYYVLHVVDNSNGSQTFGVTGLLWDSSGNRFVANGARNADISAFVKPFSALPAITNNGTNVLVYGSGGNGLREIALQTSNLSRISDTSFSLTYTQPTVDAYIGKADLGGANNRLILFGQTTQVYTPDSTSFSRVSAEEWVAAGAAKLGFSWADGAFHSLYLDKIFHYTGNRSGATDYAFTWRDDDTSGTGTAETKASPRKTITVNRQRVNVNLPSAPPDDGTADGANTATIYAAAANGALRAQTDLTETQAKTLGPFRYVAAPITTGRTAPTTSGFEGRAGGIGRYQSAAADGLGSLAQLNGDGSYRLAGANLGAAAWTGVTFQNSWANFDTTNVAQYRRDGFGYAQLRGLISGGSQNTVAFTLPAGFRPARDLRVPVYVHAGMVGYMVIRTDGTVTPTGQSSFQWYGLDGITFPLT